MADTTPTTEPTTPEPTKPEAPKPTPPKDATPPADDPIPGEGDLGDPGKKALDAMKAERNAAKAELKAKSDELDRLKAQAEGKEAEWEADKKAREAADARYRDRILKAELRAAAAGKLADPNDAIELLDLSQFELSDDDTVDTQAITSALEELVKKKPYLAAQGARFAGTPDGGARNEPAPAQLTRADIRGWSPEQIMAARAEGRLNDALGIPTSN